MWCKKTSYISRVTKQKSAVFFCFGTGNSGIVHALNYLLTFVDKMSAVCSHEISIMYHVLLCIKLERRRESQRKKSFSKASATYMPQVLNVLLIDFYWWGKDTMCACIHK